MRRGRQYDETSTVQTFVKRTAKAFSLGHLVVCIALLEPSKEVERRSARRQRHRVFSAHMRISSHVTLNSAYRLSKRAPPCQSVPK